MKPLLRLGPALTSLAFIFLTFAIAPQAEAVRLKLLSSTNTWRYLDTGTNLGTSWRQPQFDDQGWPQGPGIFSIDPAENVLGLGPIRTPLRRFINGVSAPQVTNFYFRTRFSVDDPTEIFGLFATNAVDDGAVFYLNGVEVGRRGMPLPPTPILATTFATRADDVSGHGLEVLELSPTNLLQGENVFAVELHQASSGSSDAAFGMALIGIVTAGPLQIFGEPADREVSIGQPLSLSVGAEGTPPISFQWYKGDNPLLDATNNTFTISAAELSDSGEYTVRVANLESNITSRVAFVTVLGLEQILLTLTNTWRFHALGTDLGTSWRQFDFDDSQWPAGPGALGYETNQPNAALIRSTVPLFAQDGTPVRTHYFRTSFVWTNQSLAARFICTNLVDDGAAFYLNGVEVGRLNLYTSSNTGKHTALADVEASFQNFEFVAENLHYGTNIFAAEVHQRYSPADDLVFGATLTAKSLPEDYIKFTREPNNLTLFEGTGSALFEVKLVAGRPYFLQWFHDGIALAGETNLQLRLPTASSLQAGVYYARITTAAGRADSRLASFTVIPSLNGLTTLVPFNHEWRFDQSGRYPGSNWTKIDFDDSAWGVGLGVFANPLDLTPVPPRTPLQHFNAEGDLITRYYFRARFNSPRAAAVHLLFTNVVDDGVAFYLNGTEIYRARLGTGDITGPVVVMDTGRAYREVAFLTNHLLRAGENVLSAVVLRSSFSSMPNVAFGTEMHVFPISKEMAVITRQPASGLFAVGGFARVDVQVFGTPPFLFQWYRDNSLIPGATNRVFELDSTTNSSGMYHVRIDTPLTRLVSDPASITVSDQLIPVTLLTRGPYLQSGTVSNILVRWRTDTSSASTIRLGTNALNLDREVHDPRLVQEHEVRLENLQPNTRYYYSVETPLRTLARSSEHAFVTAPTQAKPTRIWALGSPGTGYGRLAAVVASYATFATNQAPDVLLSLGDNAPRGTDAGFQTEFFDKLPSYLQRTPLWSTIGNRELFEADSEGHFAYLDVFSFPTDGEAGGVPSGSERYYSFDYGNIHFVCLDSELPDRTPQGPMLTWLRADLEANRKDWLIAFWHFPPYTKGNHDSDDVLDNGGNMVEMRQNALPILEQFGVDLVLCGGNRSYERTFLLNGHYGFSTNLTAEMVLDAGSGRVIETGPYRKDGVGPAAHQGTVYVVAGSASLDDHYSPLNHPAMRVNSRALGSVVIDVNGHQLDARFLTKDGTIDDHFTIIKGAGEEELRLVDFKYLPEPRVSWSSVAGRQYRVEATSSLQPTAWSPVSDWISATAMVTHWTNALPPTSSQWFYRVTRR